MAATVTLITVTAVILGLAASLAPSDAPSFEEQRAGEIAPSADRPPNRPDPPKRSDGRRPFADGA